MPSLGVTCHPAEVSRVIFVIMNSATYRIVVCVCFYSAGSWSSSGSGRGDAVSTSASRGAQLCTREDGVGDSGLPALGRRAAAHALVPSGRTEHAAQRRDTQHDQHQRPVTDFTDFPDCLPILLSISVFTL